MSEKRCKLVSCDYSGCNEWTIVDEISAHVEERDGGFTRWNEYKYEPLPNGWSHRYFENGFHDLCPEHNKRYEELVQAFINEVIE